MGVFASVKFDPSSYNFNEDAYKNPVGYNQNKQTVAAGIDEAKNRTAPQMTGATIDTTSGDQLRTKQMGIFGDLERTFRDRISGAAPSLAELQLKQANDRAIAAVRGGIASQAGLNPALAARLIGKNTAGLTQQNAQQSAIMRQQEVENAQNALGQLGNQYGQVRSQDVQQATNQAQLQQSTQQVNLQAKLAAQAQMDNMVSFYTKQGFDLDQSKQMAQLELERSKYLDFSRTQQQKYDMAVQDANQTNQFWGQMLGGLMNLGTQYAMGGNTQKKTP